MSARSIDVHAAGAVCWKVVDGEVRVLLVHRTQHKDVSLPKGKVDPGETLAETAQREILEETGLHIVLGVPLGKSEYRLPGGKSKRVHYWSAEVDPGEAERSSFEPNGEIAGLEWLNIKKAIKAVTYEHDGDILRTFETLFNNDRLDTFPVIVVRHGKALPPEKWDGPDWSRPLAHRGLVQAQDIAGGLAAFGPQRIMTSTASRCQATISPLSLRHEIPVKTMKGLSQDAYAPRLEEGDQHRQEICVAPGAFRAVLPRPCDPANSFRPRRDGRRISRPRLAASSQPLCRRVQRDSFHAKGRTADRRSGAARGPKTQEVEPGRRTPLGAWPLAAANVGARGYCGPAAPS